MLAFILYALIPLLLITSQVSGQNQHPASITCYMKFESEETKIQSIDHVLSYHYHQTETTQYQTVNNELCSKVGCACFSYQTACGSLSPPSNHVSQCTDDDRQNRVVKWHRGWTSLADCQQMTQQPQAYTSLTCCYTDRCNNQPGKITKFVEKPKIRQLHDLYGKQYLQPLPVSHKPPQSYDSYAHQPTQPHPVSHKPPQSYDSYDHQPAQPRPVPHKPPQSYDSYDHQPTQPLPVSHKPPQSYDSYGHQSSIISHPSSSSSPPRHKPHTRRPTTTRLPDTYRQNEVYDTSSISNASLLFSSFPTWMVFLSLVFCLLNMVQFY